MDKITVEGQQQVRETTQNHTAFLLVDFSNYVMCCYFPAVAANEQDAKYDVKQVFRTNLEQKLDSIHRVLAESGVTSFRTFFVEDRPAKAKLELYPEYKGNREKKEFLFNPKEVGKAYLKDRYPNAVWCWVEDNEADDAIASFVSTMPEVQFIVASSDKDLWQLAAPNVKIFRLTSNRFLEPADVEKEFRTQRTDLVPLYKSLWGDSGDNVKNLVPRMQKNLMPVLELTNGSLDDFWAKYAQMRPNLTQRCQELVESNKASIDLNWALVKLKGNLPVTLEVPRAIPADAASECGEGQQR